MSTDQALVLAGHGSHKDHRSAAPVNEHADRLRERGCFDTVRTGFWKEQPSLAEVVGTLDERLVFVVPLLASEGYFADRVFPRELGLEGGPHRGDQVLRYIDPVGTHEHLGAVITDRVEAVTAGQTDIESVGVALIGHGTDRHESSAYATVAHADRLRAEGRFAAVEAAFLDQTPHVADILDRFATGDIVIVPLFVSNGHHVRRDIPEAVGLPAHGDPFGGPTWVAGHRLWYTKAVGTAPSLVDVILERAAEVGADVTPGVVGSRADMTAAEADFLQWLEAGQVSHEPLSIAIRCWGEIRLTVDVGDDRGRRYTMCHRSDRSVPSGELDRLATVADIRTRTGLDDAGNHRSLRTARDLPTGWRFQTTDPKEAVQAVRAIYPACIDHWYQSRQGTLRATAFETVVERQAGRYRDLDSLEPTTLANVIDACCGDCVRRRAWARTADQAGATARPDGEADVSPERPEGPFPCPEPCSYLLETVRALEDEASEVATDGPTPCP